MSQTIIAKLFKALKGVSSVTKDAKNPMLNCKYATLANVLEVVLPALEGEGLLLRQECLFSEQGGLVLKTGVSCSETGDYLHLCLLPVVTKAYRKEGEKEDAQTHGSGLTYARRYSLMTAFNLVAEDDDGNAASGVTATPPKTIKAMEQVSNWIKGAKAQHYTPEKITELTGLEAGKMPTAAQYEQAYTTLKAQGLVL